MDDLAEYINSLTLHISIRNWLYRVERTSKATTPDDFMRDLITSVGAYALARTQVPPDYDQPTLWQVGNAIEAVAEFLQVNISKYNINDLWGYR